MSAIPPPPPPPGLPPGPDAPAAAGRPAASGAATAKAAGAAAAAAPLFRLLPLDCPRCGAPIAAEGEDVIYYCTACHTGYRLAVEGVGAEGGSPGLAAEGEGRTGGGVANAAGAAAGGAGAGAGADVIVEPAEALAPVEVAFVALPDRAAGRYLPFWLLPARVEIRQRKAAGGTFRGLLDFFLGGDDDHPPGEGTFVIPAYDTPLANAVALARRYTEAFPRLGERLGEKLTGGRLGAEDAKKLAHFTLIASEAEKPDTLKDLDYRIDFGPPRLLGVPFVEAGGRWVDALFSLPA